MAVLINSSGASVCINGAVSNSARPDFAFFRGKTLAFIAGGEPGGFQDRVIRALIPSLETTLGAKVNEDLVQNFYGDSVIAADRIANAAPNGLTFGIQNLSDALYGELTNAALENFKLQNEQYLSGVPSPPYLLVSCEGSSMTSLPKLLRSARTVTVLDALGASDVVLHSLLATYGVSAHYLTGYSDDNIGLACQRGDGDITMTTATNLLNTSLNGFSPGVKLLMATGEFAKGTPEFWLNKVATTIAAVVRKDPPKTMVDRQALDVAIGTNTEGAADVVYAQQGVEKSKILALSDAFKRAWVSPNTKRTLLKGGYSATDIDPSALVPYIKGAIRHFSMFHRYLAS